MRNKIALIGGGNIGGVLAEQAAYRELGREERLQLWIEPEMGHGFSKAMQARALAWFQRWL